MGSKKQNKKRCTWVKESNPLYCSYHDKEWGRKPKNNQKHFELLILEGAQAGLSWETVLNRRENYREAFLNFDYKKLAQVEDSFLESCLKNEGLIRNRLKIFSVRKNAQAFIELLKEFKSFDSYILSFFEESLPVKNRFEDLKQYPTQTKESDKISKDLKKRGFKFIGSTIIYAYLQAAGYVDDHMPQCDLA